MWNHFDADKKYLKNQYKEQEWDINSGLSAEKLNEDCKRLVSDSQGKSFSVLKAEIMAYIFDNAQIYINPHDWFPAQINHDSVVTNIRSSWIRNIEDSDMKNVLKKYDGLQYAISGLYDFSHIAPDWECIIRLGLPGIIERLESCSQKECLTKEQSDFYTAALIAYKGLVRYIRRLSDSVKAISCSDKKLQLVSKSLFNLTVAAPQNLLEVMQLVYIFYYVQTWVEGENVRSLGEIDKLYIDFYKNDIESQTFTENELRELIDYFYYEFYAVGAIANSPFCLCGKNADGTTYINELSYVLLEEYIKCDVDDPKIHIRYSPDLPNDFLQLILRSIINGNNSIVFMNDEVAISSLVRLGIDIKDALNYVPIGCYEPSVCGKEVPCSCAGRINLAKAVEYVMSNGIDLKSGSRVYDALESPNSFSEFYKMVKDKIKCFIDSTTELINTYESYYMSMNPSPLLSGTMQECVSSGNDVYAGGAKYNNTSICLFGIADLIDSIYAVKKLVFTDQTISYLDFCEVLKNNWEGNELLNLKCKNLFPKYGNNDDEIDSILTDIIESSANYIRSKRNSRGGVYRCGIFSIDWYQGFGRGTGATPNGRYDGEWLSKNLSPTIGNDKNGVTSLINSVTKLDYTNTPDGAVLDLTLHSSAVKGEEGLLALYGILKTFMQRGGMAIQFNVLNPEQLKAAQKDPDLYPNLQVRLCGWNVYFINLSKGEQDEFIKMTEHSAE